jgi:hypothetical protein
MNYLRHHAKIIVSLGAILLTVGCASPAIRANAASGIAITYDAQDTQNCTVLAQVESDPRPLGGTLPGMVNDMVNEATALHADTLLVLPHGHVITVLKGVAYRCTKSARTVSKPSVGGVIL